MPETSTAASSRLGLIAGAGKFPLMVLDGAQRAGCHVTVIGLKGLADAALIPRANVFRWAGLARLRRWIRILQRNDTRRVILAGSVEKTAMYGRWRFVRSVPDLTAAGIWFFRLPDKRNDTVLSAVAGEFAEVLERVPHVEHLGYGGDAGEVAPGAHARVTPANAVGLVMKFAFVGG